MERNQKHNSLSGIILLVLVLINAVVLRTAYTVNEKWYWALLVSLPLLVIAIRHSSKKHVCKKILIHFKTKSDAKN